jgi:hypothetical protein
MEHKPCHDHAQRGCLEIDCGDFHAIPWRHYLPG